ncbi:MAG: ExbD/TolR family protein [bacterium]
MKVFRLPEEESFFPQITPLVDIVLLVLIFFLVTATYSSVPRQIDVDLPETGAADRQVQTELRLFITADGSFRLQDRQIPADEVSETLQKVVGNVQGPAVLLISADRRVRYQTLIELVEKARRAGIDNFGFEVTLRGNR